MEPTKPAMGQPVRPHSATPDQRDRFLAALDSNDQPALRDLAVYLRGCTNLLPSDTCLQLGLENGSTYGQAVSAIERTHTGTQA